MFLVNLTLAQLIALFGAGALLTVALYLLDRTRRRQPVSTLRFFTPALSATQTTRRRRIHQPWSLFLQLLGLLLLLLAIGQLKWGDRGPAPRDHVIILDTSAWMGARLGQGLAMDDAKRQALAYLRVLPPEDRAMVIKADATAAPLTLFETSRPSLEAAIRQAQPSPVSLHLEEALAFALRIQKARARNPGEIVLISMLRAEGETGRLPPNWDARLRVVPVAGALENCGLRQVSLKSSPADPGSWEAVLSVRNYGLKPRRLTAVLRFGGAIVAAAPLTLAANRESQVTLSFRTRAAGELEVALEPGDALPEDNFARLMLPSRRMLNVHVYAAQPDALRLALSTNPMTAAAFFPCGADTPPPKPDILIFDGCRPSGAQDEAPSIWIQTANTAPGPALNHPVKITSWNPAHPLTTGLRSLDLPLEQALALRPRSSDEVIAESDAGPVILARSAAPRQVVLGFHPLRGRTRYELAAPLLLANILRWLNPQSFAAPELIAGSIGPVTVPLAEGVAATDIRVTHERGGVVPFSLQDGRLRFFAGQPGAWRVVTPLQEQTYSLTLPEVAAGEWTPPSFAARGVPPSGPPSSPATDLWMWLALSGGFCLLADWLLFGRLPAPGALPPSANPPARFPRWSRLIHQLLPRRTAP